MLVTELANSYKGQCNGDFNHHAVINETRFLEKLSKKINADREALQPIDVLAQGENIDTTEAIAAKNAIKSLISKALDSLRNRERQVIEYRFGFTDGNEHTLEEVGKFFNIPRETARQIEARALRKLRHPSKIRSLKDYVN